MKRYNQVRNGSYEPRSEMVEETNGDWVWYEDVEAQCAELESKCAELLEALEEIITQTDGRNHYVVGHDRAYAIARAAIAKAKGGSHED